MRSHHVSHHIALTAWFGAMLSLALFLPDAFALAFQEDGWGEWATFFAFAAASISFGAATRHAWIGGAKVRSRAVAISLLFALSLGCLFIAGEEVSWGQRLLGIVPERFFLERNYQREINFHNFIEALGGKSAWLLAGLAFGYGLVLPCLLEFVRRVSPEWVRDGLPGFEYTGWFVLVGVGALTHPFELSDEALELLLGLLFVLEAEERRTAARLGREPRRSRLSGLAIAGVALGLGIASPPLLDRWFFRADPVDVELARRELAALATDLEEPRNLNGVYFRSLDLIHKRLATARDENLVRIPADGRFATRVAAPSDTEHMTSHAPRRRQYALDPWGGAYWMMYSRAHRGLLLYSMGPNGRRDTHFGSLTDQQLSTARLTGDDLGVWLDFSSRLE